MICYNTVLKKQGYVHSQINFDWLHVNIVFSSPALFAGPESIASAI